MRLRRPRMRGWCGNKREKRGLHLPALKHNATALLAILPKTKTDPEYVHRNEAPSTSVSPLRVKICAPVRILEVEARGGSERWKREAEASHLKFRRYQKFVFANQPHANRAFLRFTIYHPPRPSENYSPGFSSSKGNNRQLFSLG